MDRSEFQKLANYFADAFPQKAKWLTERPGTLEIWFRILVDTEIQDAALAITRLVSGRQELPDSWEMIAARIRDVAKDCRRDRLCDEASESRRDEDHGTHHGPCELCHDSGLVECWHSLSVKCVEKAKYSVTSRKTGETHIGGNKRDGYLPKVWFAVCPCSLGDRFSVLMQRGKKANDWEPYQMPRYDESGFCRKITDDLEEDARAWLAERVTSMPGYSETLADF